MLLCDHALNMPVNMFINFILINLTSMMDYEVEIIKIAESLGCRTEQTKKMLQKVKQ